MQTSIRAGAIALLIPLATWVDAVPLRAQTTSQGLQHCEKPLGTMAVVEPDNLTLMALLRYSLPSPASLIRMMIQRSGCFLVVERGVAMHNMMQERALARSGELQQQSNIGGGQMRAADFILTPNVIFSEGNSGGLIGGIASRAGGLFGAVAATGLKFKEAQTSMLVSDTRTGLQIAAAEGKARKSDFGFGAIAGFAGIGAYSNTNEGKVIAASMLNNYNSIIIAISNDPNLPSLGTNSEVSPVRKKVRADADFVEGDVLAPKINNVKIVAGPAVNAREIGLANKTDEMVFLGEEKAGFVKVQTASAEGWVRKTLVVVVRRE